MIKVGVTGGIGSGKTTFCKKMEELGAYVLYADDFAKELMTSDSELKASIKQAFGDGAYFGDGSLNREYLAEEAFAKGRVEELNSIVHPILWERTEALANAKEKEGVKVFVKEAAILLNNGRPKGLKYVILLLTGEEERIERTLKRDDSSIEKVKDRISKQPDFTRKTDLADFVVENDGSLDDLEREAERVFGLLK
ncbi:MAG: dephospho-CoA kinase [Balneolaceae bacterium]|nr:dephospho-CoA kinase [Balneolaceae bacterium]MBO6546500.1 dephospho-CoA kinase [Balneolaceae bacterium]MBO6648859.1 dephospho-CoA kinase [Balneolaceae bacterium]